MSDDLIGDCVDRIEQLVESDAVAWWVIAVVIAVGLLFVGAAVASPYLTP